MTSFIHNWCVFRGDYYFAIIQEILDMGLSAEVEEVRSSAFFKTVEVGVLLL